MTAGYYVWHAVVGNPQKVIKSWGRVSRILIREEADLKVSGHFQYSGIGSVVVWGRDVGTNP